MGNGIWGREKTCENSLILAFVRFRVGIVRLRATGTLPLPLDVILSGSAGDPEKNANFGAISHFFLSIAGFFGVSEILLSGFA